MAFRELASTPAPEPPGAPWPASMTRTDEGLELAGVKLTELAAYGTPVYLLDEEELLDRARAWRKALPDGRIYYASKSFLTPAVARWMIEEGLDLDVASEGELRTALAGGVTGENLGLHGNAKSRELLALALDLEIGRIVLDSPGEAELLAEIAREKGVRAPCFVRVTTGVHAGGHEFIATAHEDQKFGLSLATGEAKALAQKVAASDSLELRGLHSHIGSQIAGTEGFVAAGTRIIELVVELAEEGISVPEIDLGGGYGIVYTALDPTPVAPAEVIAEIRSALTETCDKAGIQLPELSIEPGRSISGPAGITCYTVLGVKDVTTADGVRRYVSVDGGMSDNIRPALYQADYTAMLDRDSDAEKVACRVVGIHCESGDIVVPDVALPGDIAPGDLLVVAATGAYGRTMASNYNMLRRPGVLGVRQGRARWLWRPETWDDLLGQFAEIDDEPGESARAPKETDES
ncbi:MAG: diaminopimelate decarboxylase [Flaviflexus sp.]|nr:diaminopimelate decarboxylase [Flaviflexus sp.]